MEFNILIAGLHVMLLNEPWKRQIICLKDSSKNTVVVYCRNWNAKWGGEFHATAVYSPDGMWQTRTRLCAEAPLVWRQARDNGGRDVTISCSAGARKWHCLLNTRPSFHRRTRLAFPAHAHPVSEFPFWKAEAQRNHVFTLWCWKAINYILRGLL